MSAPGPRPISSSTAQAAADSSAPNTSDGELSARRARRKVTLNRAKLAQEPSASSVPSSRPEPIPGTAIMAMPKPASPVAAQVTARIGSPSSRRASSAAYAPAAIYEALGIKPFAAEPEITRPAAKTASN